MKAVDFFFFETFHFKNYARDFLLKQTWNANYEHFDWNCHGEKGKYID